MLEWSAIVIEWRGNSVERRAISADECTNDVLACLFDENKRISYLFNPTCVFFPEKMRKSGNVKL